MNKNNQSRARKKFQNTKSNESTLKIFHQNVQSIRNKKTNLEVLINEKLGDIDVLAFSEHWLNETEIDFIKFKGFKLESIYCRQTKTGGGTCIFIKEGIKSKRVSNFDNLMCEEHFEGSIVEIENNVIVICLYRNPKSKLEILFEKLETILNYFYNRNTNVIILGDFNINLLDDNSKKRQFLDLLLPYGLETMINSPTRVTYRSQSAIDQLIINPNVFQYETENFDSGISDHYGQKITLTLNTLKINRSNYRYNITRIYSQENITYLNNLLGKEDWVDVLTQNDVDATYNTFAETLKYYMNIAMPVKKIKINNKNKSNWITKGIRISSEKLRYLSKLMKEKYVTNNFKLYFRNYKKIYNKVIRMAKKLHNGNVIKNSIKKSNTIWNIIQHEIQGSVREKSNYSINSNGVVTENPVIIAQKFNDYFVNIASNLISNSKPIITNTSKKTANKNVIYPSIYFQPTTENELLSIINNMKNKRSSGLDEWSNFLLKKCSSHLVKPLCHIINLSLNEGYFPQSLKIAKIIPIYKKGPKTEIENYRPIALLSVFSKVIEKVVHDRTTAFINKFKILSNSQNGFQKGKSTSNAIQNVIEEIYEKLENKEQCVGIFLDLSKAFDLVDHSILINKLSKYGIRGTPLKWFESYLQNRKQLVEIEYLDSKSKLNKISHSKLQNIDYGVPQGSILGPLLFLLYINDLVECCENVNAKFSLFADDTNVLISGKNKQQLQANTNFITEQVTTWFEENKLLINKSKSIAIGFHHKLNRNVDFPDLYLGSDRITYATNIKFLGVFINNNLEWGSHVDCLSKKLSQICFAIYTLRSSVNIDILRISYFAYFNSLLSYGITFWGKSNHCSRIFQIQKKVIRIMLNLPSNTSCRSYFKMLNILTVPCIYIYEILICVHKQLQKFTRNEQIHNHYTRRRSNLHLSGHKSSLFEKSFSYNSRLLYNKLPGSIKHLNADVKFKKELKKFLMDGCFYSVQEYLEC